jgi:ASC-1-like (ASCH) protein
VNLSEFDNRKTRLRTVWGETFEGEAVYDSEEYCASEYGWAEESLNLDHWIFRRSDIASVEPLEGEPRIWMNLRLHAMHLTHPAYDRMEDGRKTLELRLNDPKRREIRVGDVIRFEGVSEDAEAFYAQVKELLPFPSFRALYAALPLSEMGYSPAEEKDASSADMDKYYSPEEQARWGVLAIRVAVL